jgi:hypothetical protein
MNINKKMFFINCDQAKHICDKSQYRESSWWDRLRLNFRYAYCNITRSYVKRNKKLSKLIKNGDFDFMEDKCKAELKIKFEKKLKNN